MLSICHMLYVFLCLYTVVDDVFADINLILAQPDVTCCHWRLFPLAAVALILPHPNSLSLPSAMPSTFSFPSPLLPFTQPFPPFPFPPMFNGARGYNPGKN